MDQVPAGGEDDADIAPSMPSKDNVEETSESVVESLRPRRLETSEVRVEKVVTVRRDFPLFLSFRVLFCFIVLQLLPCQTLLWMFKTLLIN